MKVIHKKATRVGLAIGVLSIGVFNVYADDIPDSYQNGGSNNIAYDLSSKSYVGGNLGYSFLCDYTVISSNQDASVSSSSTDFGLFGGYKFNNYFGLEANLQRLAHIQNKSHSSFPLSYRTNVFNFSLDGVASYPVISNYQYTTSLYGEAGYGVNFANYNYNLNDGSENQSDSLYHGAYNFGFGINIDFRSNISTRLGYNYYQISYPLPGAGNQHNANVFTFGIYYNFS